MVFQWSSENTLPLAKFIDHVQFVPGNIAGWEFQNDLDAGGRNYQVERVEEPTLNDVSQLVTFFTISRLTTPLS